MGNGDAIANKKSCLRILGSYFGAHFSPPCCSIVVNCDNELTVAVAKGDGVFQTIGTLNSWQTAYKTTMDFDPTTRVRLTCKVCCPRCVL